MLRRVRTNGSIGGAKASSTRTRVAAAQAVLSVALLLVVYLTLLRPDSDNGMLAVQAKQGSEFSAEGSFNASRGELDGGTSQGSAGPDPLAPADLPAPESLGAPPNDTVAPLDPGSSDPPPGESPTGAQYADAVSLLLGRLRASD